MEELRRVSKAIDCSSNTQSLRARHLLHVQALLRILDLLIARQVREDNYIPRHGQMYKG